MTSANDIPLSVLIVVVLTILVLAGAYLAARYTIRRDEREIQQRAQSSVDAWWQSADVGLLPDERDLAGDGSDEGLIREPGSAA